MSDQPTHGRITCNLCGKCRSCKAKLNKIKRAVANNDLDALIKQGCYDEKGTDEKVKCSEVYGSYWWPIVRAAVLKRDQMKCKMCGTRLHSDNGCTNYEVHHILPRHAGGSDHPFNLISLCVPCHGLIHHNRKNEVAEYWKKQTRLEVWGCDRV